MNPAQVASPTLSSPWGELTLAEGAVHAIRLGPRDLWLEARDGEIWFAHAAAADVGGEGPSPNPTDEAIWSRWAAPNGETRVALRPAFPDRPLVLEPERPFWLLPRAKARIYVRVPLWVRVELLLDRGQKQAILLAELPTSPMSDTWWGTVMEGELAYWLATTARREVRPELFAPHLAICPLVMSNLSEDDLRVEKLAFRVAHLSLFLEENRFWADASIVDYRGESEGSQIEMTGRPPNDAPSAVRVAAPRTPVVKGFRARTFDRLITLPGMGGT